MHTLNQCIAGDHQLLVVTGVEQRPVITNTQCHTALTGKPSKVAGDQFELTGLMMFLIRQSFVLTQGLKTSLTAFIGRHFYSALSSGDAVENTVDIFKRIGGTKGFRQIDPFINNYFIGHIDTVDQLVDR